MPETDNLATIMSEIDRLISDVFAHIIEEFLYYIIFLSKALKMQQDDEDRKNEIIQRAGRSSNTFGKKHIENLFTFMLLFYLLLLISVETLLEILCGRNYLCLIYLNSIINIYQ
ncbi:hypothetical protein ACJX0J_040428 [Zea mays]